MKKMRKLVPAFAMLMVAAIMMSTASYAWFTMSTTATASGMAVQATTSGGLAIAYALKGTDGATAPGAAAFQSSATFNSTQNWSNGAHKLSPTSTDLTGSKWYTASSAAINASAAVAGTYAEVASNNTNKYYFKTTMYVKSLDESADTTGKDLYVDMITSTEQNNGLEASLRVAINVGNTWLFFAPNYEELPEDGLNYVSSITVADGKQTAVDVKANKNVFCGEEELTGALLLDGGLEYTDPTEVNVYVYFEGEDDNCKSALAYNLTDLGISITFTSED